PPNHPVYALLGQRGLSRYPFDLNQAERLMAEAGWTRGPGGTYRSATGEPFTFDITFSDGVENTKAAEAVAGQWKAAGLADVTLTPISNVASTAVRNEGRHSGRGAAAFPRGGPAILAVAEFTTAEFGTPENRYT